MTNEDIIYIKYVYEKKDSALKPNVRRIVRAYNEVFKDRLKRPLSENICACSLRPYLVQLYRKLLPLITSNNIIENANENEKTNDVSPDLEVEKTVKCKKNVKSKTNKNKKKSHSDVTD